MKPNVKPALFPVVGLCFGFCFWVFDTIFDVYIFHEGLSFLDNLLFPEPDEVWERMLVVCLFVFFSLFAKKTLMQHRDTSIELTTYKEKLDVLVDDRTIKLKNTNAKLTDEINERKKTESELKYLATIDPLTSLTNRRKFDVLLKAEIKRSNQNLPGFSLIFCDIDFFKTINDSFGHDVGDSVLKMFASKIKAIIHDNDIVARWGGEEFVILLHNSSAEVTATIAEKIRVSIKNNTLLEASNLTISVGYTTFVANDTCKSILKRADEAMYIAKKKGRDRVESQFATKDL